MNERKIFEKYLARYLLVVLVVILCCIPFGINTYRYIREYTISKNVSQLEKNIHSLDNQIEKMNMIASMMGEDEHLLRLASIQGELPGEKYLYMRYVKQRLFDIHNIYDFASMSFLIFRRNQFFISASQVDEDYSHYYGRFLTAGDMKAEEFRNLILGVGERSPYLSIENMRYYGSQKEVQLDHAVLYIEPVETGSRIGARNAFLVFIIDEQKIIDMLLADDYRNHALLLIQDKNGQNVVGYGAEWEELETMNNMQEGEIQIGNSKYWLLRYKELKSGLTITAGYPMANIYGQLHYIIKLLLFYVALGGIVAILLTVLWTIHWFKPIRKILYKVSQLDGIEAAKNNEYDYIWESILKLVSDKDEMEMKMLLADAQKQAIMVENMFIKGFSSQEQLERFKKMFSYEENGYYVVIFRVGQSEQEQKQQILLYAMELFQKQCRNKMVQVHPESDISVVLIAADAGLDDASLQEMLHLVSDMVSTDYEANLVIGISRKQTDLNRVNVAFAQARQTVNAYSGKHKGSVEFYQLMYDTKKNYFHMDSFRKLYDLILCADRQGIKREFQEMRQEIQNEPEKYEFQKFEIYYAIQFILHSVCQQMALPVEGSMHTSIEIQNCELSQCLWNMQHKVMEVCDLIDGRKASRNEKLRLQILEYMEKNFNRPELNADIASTELNISEKYIYSFLKEQTGRTFAGYLEERRVVYAKTCLEQTDWSNEKIAQESGFGSANTFYRIFKKQVGVSPSVYRKSQNK
ncbi:MAG: helix-turn-helix domain-containing protein [bacterium]|nr:helix-turn-helix domain-containing protein [bacterium]